MIETEIYATLEGLGISYQAFAHPPALTMDDCAAFDEAAGIRSGHCKNLFLTTRNQSQHYLLLLRGDKKFRTAELSPQLGISRLSFASSDVLRDRLRCEPGAISPMGLLFDPDRRVALLIDEDLQREESICFHPNVNTASFEMKGADFFGAFLGHTGHTPRFVHIASTD